MNKTCPNFCIENNDFSLKKKVKIKKWLKSQELTKPLDWKTLIALGGDDFGQVRIQYNEKMNLNKVNFVPKTKSNLLAEKIQALRDGRQKKNTTSGVFSHHSTREECNMRLQQMYSQIKEQVKEPSIRDMIPSPDRVFQDRRIYEPMLQALPEGNAMKVYLSACLSLI